MSKQILNWENGRLEGLSGQFIWIPDKEINPHRVISQVSEHGGCDVWVAVP